MKNQKAKKALYATASAAADSLKGMCMAFADSVPGVSGGTIAFLMGFYDKFIGSIACLIKGSKRERIDALIYLIKIGIGWAAGFIIAMLAISAIFESHIYTVSSVFIGLTVAAIPVIIFEERATLRGKWLSMLLLPIGAAVVVLLTYFIPYINSSIVDLSNMSVGAYFYLFFAGVICIAAMVMPGISGSSMLMIFGIYAQLVNALSSFLKGQLSYFWALLVFGLGVIVGIFTFARIAKLCLKKFRPQTVYCIIGLMIGSVYAIVIGPTTLESAQPAVSASNFQAGWFILGVLIPVILALSKIFVQRRRDKKAAIAASDCELNCEVVNDCDADTPAENNSAVQNINEDFSDSAKNAETNDADIPHTDNQSK
ncbi:MAG: DUF368 domain-containing protein [Clostridia bacterium]|nr:DUF368 domain-containing protein [Clostridia bacterium]